MAEGFDGASTDRMLARFGGSKATLFRHYPSKSDLFLAVIRRIGERLVEAGGWPDLPDDEPRAWLQAFAEASLQAILVEDALFVGRMVVAHGPR